MQFHWGEKKISSHFFTKSLFLIQQSQCLEWKQDNPVCKIKSVYILQLFRDLAFLPPAEKMAFCLSRHRGQHGCGRILSLFLEAPALPQAVGGTVGSLSLSLQGAGALGAQPPAAGPRAVSRPLPRPWSGRLGSAGCISASQLMEALHFLMGGAGVQFDLGGSVFKKNSNPHHFSPWIYCKLSQRKGFKKKISGPVVFTAQHLMNRCC